MFILLDNETLKEDTLVMLGNFDGIHRGHKALLDKAKQIKNNCKVKIAIMTFLPHPKEYFTKEKMKTIYSNDEKIKYFEKEEVDYYKICKFDDESSRLDPEEFFYKYLVKQLNAKYIVVGEGYKFANNKSGNVKILKKLGEKYDIEVFPVNHIIEGEDKISSTEIRVAISNGNIKYANYLLGKPFSVMGIVAEGKQIGRTIGCPTANIITSDDKLLPKNGVYHTESYYKGVLYPSITNVGINPTIGANKQVVETHIIDFDDDMYGQNIDVLFYDYIREEKKFESIQQLKEQIQQDIQIVKSKQCLQK